MHFTFAPQHFFWACGSHLALRQQVSDRTRMAQTYLR